MTLDLSKDESNTLEYKEKVIDKVFESLSAFCNTNGGSVILGVADNKAVVGIDLSNGKQESIINKTIDLLGIQPDIKVLTQDDKKIMVITVQKSSNPIPFKGKYYKRVGNTTREMHREELKKMFLKEVSWDNLTGNYSIDEIDAETVKYFIKLANSKKRIPIVNADESIESILERLDLIIDGKLTNASILLFGKNPQKHFTSATLRVGAFKDNTGVTIIGDKQIKGNLFKQAIDGEEALKFYNNVRYVISGKLQRDEYWDYPLDAVREALLNALIHRDYFDSGTEIQAKVFKDSLWIYNSGGLTGGLTLEQIKGQHPSRSRNKLIMNIFYLSGMVERFGSGISRIIDECRIQLLPEPEFKEEFGGFSVYFRKEFTNLNNRQKKAVEFIREKGAINNSLYQELTQTTRETSKRDLNKMVELGIINKVGEGKATKYILPTMTHNDP